MLTNKVMKHGFVTAMEDILDADKKTTHEKLATQVCHKSNACIQKKPEDGSSL